MEYLFLGEHPVLPGDMDRVVEQGMLAGAAMAAMVRIRDWLECTRTWTLQVQSMLAGADMAAMVSENLNWLKRRRRKTLAMPQSICCSPPAHS